MSKQAELDTLKPTTSVEHVEEFHRGDLNDLCDAANSAIADGNGLGWLDLPMPEEMKRYWNGIVPMPTRDLFVARMDGVICGACQTVKPRPRNKLQKYHLNIITHFVAPWARGHDFTRQLFELAEKFALEHGFKVINMDIRETLTEAMKIYEELGFTKYGEHPAHTIIDGEVLKGYYYCKIIDPELVKTMNKKGKGKSKTKGKKKK